MTARGVLTNVFPLPDVSVSGHTDAQNEASLGSAGNRVFQNQEPTGGEVSGQEATAHMRWHADG